MTLFDLAQRAGVAFDPAEVLQRYAAERAKRLRTDTAAQFIEVTNEGRFSKHVRDDPFAPPAAARDPLQDEVEVAIVGGGWVGLITAARLVEAGVTDVRIIESGADFGGTWYWNRYPGAQCDIESYIYLPLLEETGYVPKQRYSYSDEIYEHAQRIGKHFGLYDHAVFQTLVKDMRWDAKEGRWLISTDRGDQMRSRYVVLATGAANRPRLPGIPGLDAFEGHAFHTSRWDYTYTGGGIEGGLDELGDKRVAVIGTGATAVQCVPRVAQSAAHLYVFQRTPSCVGARNNRPTDPEWANSLQPGWQKDRMRQFDNIVASLAGEVADLPDDDEWFRLAINMQDIAAKVDPSELTPQGFPDLFQLADLQTMEQIRQRVADTVCAEDVAEKLKPFYNFLCKRPTFNDEYLEAFNSPNVTLVDVSDNKGVERITQKGIVANGVEYDVDCIIFASGFEITSDFHRRIGIEIAGENGQSLYDFWADGMRTMHGFTVRGFPNLLLVGGLFAFTLGVNYCSVVDDQAQHAAYIISELNKRGVKSAEPTAQGEEAWIAAQMTPSTVPLSALLGGAPETCTPGYYNQEGRSASDRRDVRLESFGQGREEYLRILKEWRAAGGLDGLGLRYDSVG
ncbi:flavin-containing monooxygenase [Mycobacterium vicinigordonae]|uniref:NAD(P)/FAD-dependent oxidoreductase n=1 Tax=Mycobacterium vicinigordonae TaxID=1719132 RepID=A0A7D6HND9_9MYCO|nr:NAD(P)/FAD-dependent oxidoreductase [Mycobacterium vicinigordonae]QLL06491.1 NAD(P)/FAD-dependent oxidoreductase [Mycobacterium vicinigordonae]